MVAIPKVSGVSKMHLAAPPLQPDSPVLCLGGFVRLELRFSSVHDVPTKLCTESQQTVLDLLRCGLRGVQPDPQCEQKFGIYSY